MKLMKKLENIFAAVAFAEEGDSRTAVEIMEETDGKALKTRDARGHREGHERVMPKPVKA